MNYLAFSIGNQGQPGATSLSLPAQVPQMDLKGLLPNVINILLFAAILLSLIFFLIGGIKWLTSQGDKKAVEGAQKTITYAIVGLLIVFVSFFVINLIGFLFQVPLIHSLP